MRLEGVRQVETQREAKSRPPTRGVADQPLSRVAVDQPNGILNLQRTLGNRLVYQLLSSSSIQAKLKVSEPGDHYEQEADRVAMQVMQMSDSAPAVSSHGLPGGVQRKCSACAGGGSTCPQCAAEEPTVQRQASTVTITPLIQRELNVCENMEEEQNMSVAEQPAQQEQNMSVAEEEEPVQRQEASIQRSADGNSYASSDITHRIQSTKGQGAPLPENVQHELGSKMGADFSGIRIHTNSGAVQLNRDLGAHAFTHGKDIYFGAGKYDPHSVDGKYLLAHELAHTMQQNSDIVRRLTISVQTPLAKGPCGEKSIRWIFALTNPAPADGYIVQQLDAYEQIVDCPMSASCLVKPTKTFWEAWYVNKGDTHEHLHSALGYTDAHSRPSRPNKSGYDVSAGEVKFYPKSVTGDIGKDGVAPASPNGGWGPGNEPLSGSLPSTKTKPSWWSNAPTEGPANRMAYAAWSCCTGRNFNVIKADP